MLKVPLTSIEVDIINTLDFEGAMPIPRIAEVIKARSSAIQPDNDDVYHAIENLIRYGKVGLAERRFYISPVRFSIETYVFSVIRRRPIGVKAAMTYPTNGEVCDEDQVEMEEVEESSR